MANSTTTLDTIQTSQAGKEITANQLFDAMSTAAIFGRRASTTSALTWGYYGGAMAVSGTPTQIANGTVALTASSTNYVEAVKATGVVVKNTTGWTGDTHIPLYKIITGTSTVTSYEDFRSMQGPKGDAGPTGGTGGMTYNGAGAPSGGTGVNGDLYINTTNGDLYQKASGSWGSPIGNIKGPTGSTGASGGVYIAAAGVPGAGTGNNGDLYVNTSNGDLYQKVAGTWGSALMNIKGPAGAAGADGVTGSLWYQGTGVPSAGTGANGDFYLRTSNGDYYQKAAGAWGSPLGNLTGPAGSSGGGLQSVQATFPGTLVTLTGAIRWYPRSNISLTNVFVSMGTAPSTGGAVFNVRKNGTAIFTSPKPTVASGANTSGANAISVALTTTDYLTVDVETASGGDAVVRIDYT